MILTPYDRSFCAFELAPKFVYVSEPGAQKPFVEIPRPYNELDLSTIGPSLGKEIQSVPPAAYLQQPLPPADEREPGLFLHAPLIIPKTWVSYFPLKLPDGARIVDIRVRYLFAQANDTTPKNPKARVFIVNVLRSAKWGASHNVHHIVATVKAPGDGQFSQLDSGDWIINVETMPSQTTLYTDRTTIINDQFGYGVALNLNNPDSFPPGVLGLGIYAIRISYLEPI